VEFRTRINESQIHLSPGYSGEQFVMKRPHGCLFENYPQPPLRVSWMI